MKLNRFGKTSGKKIKLHVDISGNLNEDEVLALLDSVEDDIENLINDCDTEFELITEDAAESLNKDNPSFSTETQHFDAVQQLSTILSWK